MKGFLPRIAVCALTLCAFSGVASAAQPSLTSAVQLRLAARQMLLSRFVFNIPRFTSPLLSSQASSVSSSSRSASSASSTSPAEDVQEVVRLVNVERGKANLPALTINTTLQNAAQAYAKDMETRHFFSHTDPDGRTSQDRIRATGYLRAPCNCSWQYWIGENIAQGQTSAAEVMRDWMSSPEHRDNILSPHFTEIGVGRSGNEWVQEFGQVTHQ